MSTTKKALKVYIKQLEAELKLANEKWAGLHTSYMALRERVQGDYETPFDRLVNAHNEKVLKDIDTKTYPSLPDCVTIPDGYQQLPIGEVLREGDLNIGGINGWKPTEVVGFPVGRYSDYYIRPIQPKNK